MQQTIAVGSLSEREWRVRIFTSTWIAYAGFYFCRKAFYIAKGTLSEELGFSATELGEMGTAYLVTYTLGQFLSAGLGQRSGARVLLLGGMAVSLGANVVFGFANNYWTFLSFMAVNGLAQATGWPATVGTMANWTRRAERGTVMGIWATCYQVGGVMANAWAGFWLVRSGVRGAFFAASLVLVAVWVYVWFFQRNKPEDVGLPKFEDDVSAAAGGPDARPAGTVWTRGVIITTGLVGLFYFGVKFVRYALWSWAPFFLQKNYGLQGDEAAYLSSVFDVAGTVGVIAAGILSDRYFRSRRGKISFLMLFGMTLGCAGLTLLGGVNVYYFVACLALVGFMLYGPDSLLTGAGAIEIGSRRAALAAAGIINGMGSVGSVFQETVVGNLYQSSGGDVGVIFSTLFGASALAMASIGVVLWRNKKGLSDL